MREKNTTFANEESVLLIDAEHCRIEKNREARWFPNRYLSS